MNESETATRDALALRRTHLANERTLLAYARTAIMLAASGVALLKYVGSDPFDWVLGAALVGAGVCVAMTGSGRFRRVRRSLAPEAG